MVSQYQVRGISVEFDSRGTLLVYASLVGIALIVVYQSLRWLYLSIKSPLRGVPGPFLARFGRLYLFYQVARGHCEQVNIALHRRYGPIVRVASDMYSFDSIEGMKKVYGVGSKFPKSDWYDAWKHPDPDKATIFAERDIKLHADSRRCFQAMYSMSNMVHYEGYVDDCAEILSARFHEFARSGESFDLARWFQHYAFDVIGDITYSQRFGFLDKGEDVAGLQGALHQILMYGSLVGIYAKWHPWLYSFTNRLGVGGGRGRDFLIKFVNERIKQRKEEKQAGLKHQSSDIDGQPAPMDFMEKLMEANQKDPKKVLMYHVWSMSLANIIAGSDTTSVSLSSILYHLLKNPETLRKLREEIESAEREGRCGKGKVTFKQSQDMPYLQAVMKEALRLCAATGTPMWRDVPKEGLELGGYHFPPGTKVGINTWCAHYKEEVWGADLRQFRPERWIEAEKGDGERLKIMEAYWIPFGLGSRTCLGRHVSFLEMSKLIPQLVRKFDFELVNPDQDWKTVNWWFIKPTNFRVRVSLRQR